MKTARWAWIFPFAVLLACSSGGTGTGAPLHAPSSHLTTPNTCTAHTGGTPDACTRASDCGAGKGCLCGEMVPGNAAMKPNQCVTAQCQTDADCGTGGFCSISVPPLCGTGMSGFFCHTAADTCSDSTDCSASVCTWTGSSWGCVHAGCAG